MMMILSGTVVSVHANANGPLKKCGRDNGWSELQGFEIRKKAMGIYYLHDSFASRSYTPAKRSNIFVQHRVCHTERSVAKRTNNV